jgi:hypothetical protein
LHSEQGGWIWTIEGREAASAVRLRDWVGVLSPESLLSSAFAAGFGSPVEPAEACSGPDEARLCVGENQATPRDGTHFVGRVRNADGVWIPVRIDRYSAGDLEDRVVVDGLAFPDQVDPRWFNPDFAGMLLEP